MSEPASLPQPRPARMGMFGGAFDPPHRAHVALALAAVEQLGLDRLYIVPTGQAWHKTRVLSPTLHRLAMAQLAFAGMDRVVVDPRETLRSGPSYTVDTLRELQAENPGAQWFVVIGQDQADALHTWHEAEVLATLAIICVAARADVAGVSGQLGHISPSIQASLQTLHMPQDAQLLALSSTDIRQRAAAGHSMSALVFAPVARYIDQHHLYRSTR